MAGAGTLMQRDYDHHSVSHLSAMDTPERIGREAAERAVARLNPVRPQTAQMPVVYHPRVAGSLLGHLAAAINGNPVASGTSFLKDRMGERLFAPGVTIRDDPKRVRGPKSRPFDTEGLSPAALDLVEDGVLRHWLLDTRNARRLGLRSNGRARRGVGDAPSPSATNLFLHAGTISPEALMSDIRQGVYVTELLGSSVNMLNGDYSRGAAGFMIRDGQLAEPVAEITIAGNLPDMFASLVPANDLRFRRGVDSPTVRVDGMTLAGA